MSASDGPNVGVMAAVANPACLANCALWFGEVDPTTGATTGWMPLSARPPHTAVVALGSAGPGTPYVVALAQPASGVEFYRIMPGSTAFDPAQIAPPEAALLAPTGAFAPMVSTGGGLAYVGPFQDGSTLMFLGFPPSASTAMPFPSPTCVDPGVPVFVARTSSGAAVTFGCAGGTRVIYGATSGSPPTRPPVTIDTGVSALGFATLDDAGVVFLGPPSPRLVRLDRSFVVDLLAPEVLVTPVAPEAAMVRAGRALVIVSSDAAGVMWSRYGCP